MTVYLRLIYNTINNFEQFLFITLYRQNVDENSVMLLTRGGIWHNYATVLSGAEWNARAGTAGYRCRKIYSVTGDLSWAVKSVPSGMIDANT